VSENQALELLRQGALVAIPTETVYGLAARIDRPESIAAIFEAKGRPRFNPLIVHTPTREAALALARSPSPLAVRLAERFWPGPLTLVVPRGTAVSPLVTAGHDSVALRVPSHPLTQRLLAALAVPVAAPSANRSTSLSPTTAEHVLQSLGPSTYVLDGGPAERGLESTVVRANGDVIEVLRWGSLSADELARVAAVRFVAETEGTPSPGMQLKHYAPKVPLELVDDPGRGASSDAALVTLTESPYRSRYARAEALSTSGDLVEAASRLFDVLYRLENDPAVRRIVAVPVPETGLGLAINDRLRRGAAR
jgi:L-threonylcarbamoyladenylate synthase